jgi:MAF protein
MSSHSFHHQQKLVLGSTSPFRQQILQKLQVTFETDSPDIDESALDNETPQELVARLSELKARAVAQRHPDALIIGSDQVSVNDGVILGKPHTHENAIQQLLNASGKKITFYTGLCLYNAKTDDAQVEVVPFHVHFRQLNEAQIDHYLRVEQPYNCAGSFKSEGYGISLFSKLEGDDPNTLIGLPLIRLTAMLEHEGFRVV